MSARPINFTPVQPASPGGDLDLPAWAARLVAARSPRTATAGGMSVESFLGDDVSLVSVRIANAADLPAVAFEHATADAYTTIAEHLAQAAAGHPVRFWNFIPGIHERDHVDASVNATAADGSADAPPLDRYMIFNAGRYNACRRWLGGEDAFPRLLATASGVGHAGSDLVIHALATAGPGQAVENPRQVPAYKYSSRYGPRPPCFARATTVNLGGNRMILVGGTASVRGEASVFVGDVRKQAGETLDNLAALLQSATGDTTAGPHLMTDVRVYHVRESDAAALRSITTHAFPNAAIEFVRADICRQDLLVEIEGVA